VFKKKGIFFWNKRNVIIDSKGVLKYFDVNENQNARSTIDLTNALTHILHLNIGTRKEMIKVVTPDQSYNFKSASNSLNLKPLISVLSTFKQITQV